VAYSVSNNENGVLQICEVEGWKAFDRPDGPPKVIAARREIRPMYLGHPHPINAHPSPQIAPTESNGRVDELSGANLNQITHMSV